MSTLPQQPQTQQPIVVYPNTVTGQAPPSQHSHSNGSFGTVFIVLAVIIAISAIACFIGRLCNRRKHQTKPSEDNHNHNSGPRERDVEFGFDGKIPAAKQGCHGEPSKGVNFKMPGNGDVRDPPTGTKIPGNGEPTGFRMPAAIRDPAALRMAGPKPLDDGGMER